VRWWPWGGGGERRAPREIDDIERLLWLVKTEAAKVHKTLDRADAAAQRAEQQWAGR
jgi:hypothetical protein